MKKMINMFAALFASVLCLSGCFMPKAMYEQADADQVTAKGREMMQAWLAEHIPDAEMTECKAYIVMPLRDGNEYLTDYAEGYIRSGETTTGFMVNTVSGAVYFKTDSETQAKLLIYFTLAVSKARGGGPPDRGLADHTAGRT